MHFKSRDGIRTCFQSWAPALFALTLFLSGTAYSDNKVIGISLTEIGSHLYDAAPAGSPPTERRSWWIAYAAIGVQQINLSPRAYMKDPRGSEVVPVTPGGTEGKRAGSLPASYTVRVMIRVSRSGFARCSLSSTPRATRLCVRRWLTAACEGLVARQHPAQGSECLVRVLRAFLDIYLPVVRPEKSEEFTIGAELCLP
jgi:hypothetical protein